MDFENMSYGCPWQVEDKYELTFLGKNGNMSFENNPKFIDSDKEPIMACKVINRPCKEEICAMYHWINELKNALYISIKAELHEN